MLPNSTRFNSSILIETYPKGNCYKCWDFCKERMMAREAFVHKAFSNKSMRLIEEANG